MSVGVIRERQSHVEPADKRYQCAICGAVKVVPSLARYCESSHMEGDDD